MHIKTNHNINHVKDAVSHMDKARNNLYRIEMSILSQPCHDLVNEIQTFLEEKANELEKYLRSSS